MTTPENQPSPSPLARREAARRHTRRWLPYAGALLLAGVLLAGFWPQPVPVETARAIVGTLRATVNEEGKTRIKQRFVVSAPVTGQLRRIPFKAGAVVEAGQTVVAVIDPVAPTLLDARARSTAEARRDSAAANLEKSRANHTFASSELRRFEKLYGEKTVSIQELEAAQMREASAAKEQAAAESALRQAEAELAEFSVQAQTGAGTGLSSASDPPATGGPRPDQESTPTPPAESVPRELKAPASGRVLHIFEENSRVVTAGTPLLEIGDATNLEVVVEVLSRDGAVIGPGTKVEFEQWGGAEPLQGRVRLVEPAAFTKVSALGVEEQRVNVVVDLLTPIEQRRGVGDNFRVEARIIVWETAQTLKVPVGALFRQGARWATFVVSDGRAHLRVVEAGRSSGTETQVLQGLKEGEEVILYPGSRVKDGQRVKEIRL